MKLIENRLLIEWKEAIDCGISENTMKSAKLKKSSSWNFLDDPEDKRKVLIDFEKLKEEYKKKVEARFGNVYEYMAKMPIRNLVKWDDKAEEFYLAYKYDGRPLPIEHVNKYARAASWLNMFAEVTKDKKKLKTLLNLTIEQFYENALEIIEVDKIDLPSSYRRLLAKCKEYNERGYSSLIDWRFGNQMAAKVNDEQSRAVLNKFISHPLQYDDVLISMIYNEWAKKEDYKTITPGAVRVWRDKLASEIVMERHGNKALGNKYLIQAQGKRPSTPLYLVENDDNVIDLLYNEIGTKSEKRMVAMVVTDSFNDLPLGKACTVAGSMSEGESIHLIKAAYVDAMYYIRQLTGGWHLFGETKSDRWALKSLKPFYQEMGNYGETPVGSKNGRYIEAFFGSHHWKRCLKLSTPTGKGTANNYSGNNITAKNRGVNMEWLAANKKNRPLIGNEANAQIEQFFHRLRHLPQTKAGVNISKEQEWLAAWNQTPSENKRAISDEQFLLKFGVVHNPGPGKTNRISNKGVNPIIGGQKYLFTIEGDWRPHEGKEVQVIYDPHDMSRALITDLKQVRFMAHETRLSPRAMADGFTNSRTYLNAVLNEKTEAVTEISNKNERRDKVLVDVGFDYEAVLQAGTLTKELKMNAEHGMMSQLLNQRNDNFTSDDILDQM